VAKTHKLSRFVKEMVNAEETKQCRRGFYGFENSDKVLLKASA